MSNFAVIETGGKQYRVSAGQKLKIEKLAPKEGGKIVFDKVLLREVDGKLDIGTPNVPGAKVEGTVLRDGRGEKKIVFKYHSKTRFRKKKGHRQNFTEVKIEKI